MNKYSEFISHTVFDQGYAGDDVDLAKSMNFDELEQASPKFNPKTPLREQLRKSNGRGQKVICKFSSRPGKSLVYSNAKPKSQAKRSKKPAPVVTGSDTETDREEVKSKRTRVPSQKAKAVAQRAIGEAAAKRRQKTKDEESRAPKEKGTEARHANETLQTAQEIKKSYHKRAL